MSGLLGFDQIGDDYLAGLFERSQQPVEAVPTPVVSWNGACGDEGGGEGLALGWHVVVAGATGAGKSLLALNIAARAIQAGRRVCYLSLEMSQTQLATRLIAILTGYGVKHLERGRGFDREIANSAFLQFRDIQDASITGAIFVNRTPLRDLGDIEMAIGMYADREKCQVFITDYMQLAWVGSAKSMLDSITEVSHSIRACAQTKKVVSVGVSQFNRQTSSNRESRPYVEGLMGGSPLENDADQVVLLDHTNYERHGPTSATTNLILAKNRHGAQLEIPVAWDYKNLQIREVTPEAAAA